MTDTVVRPTCYADAGGDGNFTRIKSSGYFLTDPLDNIQATINVRLWQKNGELIAAISEGLVRISDSPPDDITHLPEESVAGEVAKAVIVSLKGIEVQDSQ